MSSLVLFFGMAARAQPAADHAPAAPTELALLRTESRVPQLAELARSLDSALFDALEERRDVHVAVLPAFDLSAMQIAIDCVGGVEACMKMMAEQAGVANLLVPVLSATTEGTRLELMRFEAAEGTLVTAQRSQTGGADQALLAELGGMLDELFARQAALTAPSEATTPNEAAVQSTPGQPPEAEPVAKRNWHRGIALTLGVTGAALIAAGVGLNISAQHEKDDYVHAPVSSKPEIDAALSTLDHANHRATAAYASFAVGGAALVAGAAVWLVGRKHAKSRSDTLVVFPTLAPGSLGLALKGNCGL